MRTETEVETSQETAAQVDAAAWHGMQERLGVIEKVALGGRSWRHASFAQSGLLLVCLLVLAYAFTRPTWKPYYVEIDTCRGDVRVVGPAPDTLTFRDLAIQHFVRNFVMDMRGIPDETEVTKAQWRRLSHQVTQEGRQLLNHTEAEMQPLTKKTPIVVKVIRVTQREGTRYDVRWQEFEYSTKHELVKATNYGGLFTFHWGTPSNEEERRDAPLGMFFHLWQAAKE
jgi:type IV secretory pathway TrbF-like protein